MTQVKLFSTYREDELEPAMNAWLKDGIIPGIT